MSVALSPGVSGRENGFSLIELMIVVAIIGVLAGIAVFTYSSLTSDTQNESEVRAVFSEFEQKQEQFLVEHGRYQSTGASETDTHPPSPASPGDAPNEARPLPDEWEELRLSPDSAGLYCAYVARAGDAGDPTNVGSVASGTFGFEPPARAWYYLLAECRTAGDRTEYYFARSDSDRVLSHAN